MKTHEERIQQMVDVHGGGNPRLYEFANLVYLTGYADGMPGGSELDEEKKQTVVVTYEGGDEKVCQLLARIDLLLELVNNYRRDEMKQTREQYLVARIELLTNQLAKAREKLANAERKNELMPETYGPGGFESIPDILNTDIIKSDD